MYTSVRIIDETSAVFTCMHCKQIVRVQPSSIFLRQSLNTFDLTCHCGKLNPSVIEHRTTMRKESNISGIYKIANIKDKDKTGSMTVVNISWQGFKLKISGYEHSIQAHDLNSHRYKQEKRNIQSIFDNCFLKTGDQITIEFFLDDPKMSFISRPVFIKWIKNNHVGVELCNPEAFEPSIQFYLLGLNAPSV